MPFGEPTFIEHPNGRLYEVITVPGYPSNYQGRRGCCHIDHDEQRIEVSRYLPQGERDRLIAEAITGESGSRLVPIRGRVS